LGDKSVCCLNAVLVCRLTLLVVWTVIKAQELACSVYMARNNCGFFDCGRPCKLRLNSAKINCAFTWRFWVSGLEHYAQRSKCAKNLRWISAPHRTNHHGSIQRFWNDKFGSLVLDTTFLKQ